MTDRVPALIPALTPGECSHSRAGLRLLASVLAGVALAATPACSKSVDDTEAEAEAAAPTPDAPREKSREEVEAEKLRARDAKLAERLDVLDRTRATQPQKFASHVAGYTDVLDVAKGAPLEGRIRKALDELRAQVERAAQDSLQKVYAEVEPLIAAEEYEKAVERLQNWDATPFLVFDDIEAVTLRDKKIADIERHFDARLKASTVIQEARGYKSQQDFATAVAKLEAYPERFSDTPYWREVRDLLKECYEAYLTSKQAEVKDVEIEWTQIPVEPSLGGFGLRQKSGANVFSHADGEDGPFVKGENESDQDAQLMIGQEIRSWRSYLVELEVRIGSGAKELKLGLGQEKRPGSKVLQFSLYRVPLEGGTWTKLLIEVKDGLAKVSDLGTATELVNATFGAVSGGAAILLQPGDEADVRNVRYKILEKLAEEPSPAEGDDEKDGGKKGKKKKDKESE